MATILSKASEVTSGNGLQIGLGLKERASLQNWIWGLFIFFTLTILVPLVLLPPQPWSSGAMPLLLVYVSILYSGTHLAVLALQGQRKLLSLTFWVFAYIWLGVAALAQLTTGEFLWPGVYPEETQTYAAFIILVGFVAYDLGAWMARLRKVAIGRRVAPHGLRLSKQRIYLLGILAIALSAASIYLLPDTKMLFGGSEAVQEEIMISFSKTGFLIFFSMLRVPAFVALLLTLWVWIRRREFGVVGLERTALVTLLILLAVTNLLVSNPISSPRYFVGTVGLSVAFMYLGWSERHSFGIWVTGLLTTLIVMFPYADLFRWGNPEIEVQSVTSNLAVSGDYDSFQQLMNTLLYTSDYGFTFGYQLLGALFFWIPRNIWINKPGTSGELVAEYSGYSFTNLASPLWAEAYINAGLVGVVVALFAYGVITSALQSSYLERSLPYSSVLNVLVPLLAAYQVFFVRGTLMSASAYLAPMIAYLVLAVGRRHSPGMSASRPAGRRRVSLRFSRSSKRR